MSRPLKVAHLTPAFFAADSVVGGGERYVYNVAKALAAAQETLQTAVKQCVFTVAPRERLFAEGRIPVRVLRNESIFDGPMQHFAWPLWQELAGFDLIHVHQSLTIFGAFCTVVAKSLGKTLVLTDLGGGESKLMLDGKGLELADGVVSISRYAHSLISGAFSGPHEILIGPVDTDFFVPAAKAGNPRTAICVSRLLPHKGIDQVISTLPAGMSLRIVGQVYHEPYYTLLRDLARGKNVTFIHDADDTNLVELYQSSSLFVQASTAKDCYGNTSSRPELMGLTTLEAMACGLPVIVSDAGSLPELAADPRFSRVFHSRDELGRMLRDFAAGRWPDPDAGKLARSHALVNLGFEAVGHHLGRFYQSLMRSRADGGA